MGYQTITYYQEITCFLVRPFKIVSRGIKNQNFRNFKTIKKKHFFDILGNLKNKTLIINMMKQSFDIRLILEGVNIETIISFILVAFI